MTSDALYIKPEKSQCAGDLPLGPTHDLAVCSRHSKCFFICYQVALRIARISTFGPPPLLQILPSNSLQLSAPSPGLTPSAAAILGLQLGGIEEVKEVGGVEGYKT